MLVSGDVTFLNPPRGRRPWRIPENPENCGLHYLAWGSRRYGEDPIPVARQPGYVYLLMLKGEAHLCFKGSKFVCTPSTFCILHPDRMMGWRAAPGSEQKILCWIWRAPPGIDSLRPGRGQWLHWQLPAETIAALQRMHRATRNELARADKYSPIAIGKIQTDVDVALARSKKRRATEPGLGLPENLRLALGWIQNNYASTRPVADLCDRLELSPANLARLFRRHLGRTPQDFINERKIHEATKRLQSGDAVKMVAHDMGYRHSHDFSRFYHQKTGINPSTLKNETAAPG